MRLKSRKTLTATAAVTLLAALLNRGNALRALGRLEEALLAIETVLQARPDFPGPGHSHDRLSARAGIR